MRLSGRTPEEILFTFLGLMHLGIAFSVFVLGRTGGMNNSGIDDGVLAQRETLFLQITVDDLKDRRCQLVLFQQVPEVHDRGVFGDRCAQRQTCELAHWGDFVKRFLHGRIAQREPVLQQMNAQHGFQRIWFSAAAGLRVERLDEPQQATPGHDLIHLGEEDFAACLLALAGVFEIGKAHLAHRRLGSGGQAYFSTFENLFGDSLVVSGKYLWAP